MKIVGIIIGAVIGLGGAGYAGLCYMVGTKFVEAYEQEMAKSGQASQIDQSVFATTITSKIAMAGAPGGLEVVTQVDHMVMPDRWLTANTNIRADQKTAQMAKMLFKQSPEIRFTTVAHMDETKTIDGMIPPISSNPNPMFQVTAAKPLKFSATLDANNIPTKTSFSIPDLKVQAAGNSGELTGFHYNVDYVTAGAKASMNNTLKFDILKQKTAGKRPHLRLGPLNLKLNIGGLKPEEIAAMQSQGSMALAALQNKPGVSLAIPKSSLTTNFGNFEIDGKAQTAKAKGATKINGKFDVKLPFSPKSQKILGPKYTALIKALINRKLVKRSRGHIQAKMVMTGDDLKLNGKSVKKHAPALSKIMGAGATPGQQLKRTGKGKLLSKQRKDGKKKRLHKKRQKSKTAH